MLAMLYFCHFSILKNGPVDWKHRQRWKTQAVSNNISIVKMRPINLQQEPEEPEFLISFYCYLTATNESTHDRNFKYFFCDDETIRSHVLLLSLCAVCAYS